MLLPSCEFGSCNLNVRKSNDGAGESELVITPQLPKCLHQEWSLRHEKLGLFVLNVLFWDFTQCGALPLRFSLFPLQDRLSLSRFVNSRKQDKY